VPDRHLAVLALGQRDVDPGIGALLAVEAGLDRTVAHALDGDAVGELGELCLVDSAVHTGAVAARPAIGRQFELSGEAAIVGQQQQTFREVVEAAHGDDPRHALGQRVEDGAASLGIARRHHLARRLVIAPHARAVGGGQGLAVDLDDAFFGDDAGRGLQHLAVDLDATLRDPAFGIAARAQARARQALGDALAFLDGLFAHFAAAAPRKARNSFASPSEIWNSGCHCTPMQNR